MSHKQMLVDGSDYFECFICKYKINIHNSSCTTIQRMHNKTKKHKKEEATRNIIINILRMNGHEVEVVNPTTITLNKQNEPLNITNKTKLNLGTNSAEFYKRNKDNKDGCKIIIKN
tara:strand:+ start:231 stop:578 length:348 start_codon:yes stop_codon:yes gene_type:complete